MGLLFLKHKVLVVDEVIACAEVIQISPLDPELKTEGLGASRGNREGELQLPNLVDSDSLCLVQNAL